MAQRSVVAAFAVAGLIALVLRPLVAGILLATAFALFLDLRGTYGRGRFRAAIAFITGVWVALGGIVATLLGMIALPNSCDPSIATCEGSEANALFLPGRMLVVLGLTLFGWSLVELVRLRRRGA